MENLEGLTSNQKTHPAEPHGRQMPDVFAYSDYRRFLEDYYRYKKRTDRSFTYAKFSKKAGINSLNYFKLIKDGQRNLTPKNIHRFAQALGLREEESIYFEKLVHYCQSTSAEERSFYYKQLEEELESSGRGNLNHLKNDLYQYFAIFVIREMLELKDFRADVTWIQRKLSFFLEKSEIRDILLVLIQNGLVVEDKESNTLRIVESFVFYERQDSNHAVESFHIRNLENSIQMIRQLPFDSRDMVSATIAIREGDFKKILKEMNKNIGQLVKKYGVSGEADEVVQLNCQFLKVTK